MLVSQPRPQVPAMPSPLRSFTATLFVFIFATAVRGQPADPYKPAVERLTALIEHEVKDKRLPALSIAVVDDQRVVWSAGFGHRDRERQVPATAGTVYRVGSVSKLFTDVAVMRLVEDGKIDLDAPVTKYLPGFKPATKPEHKPITLRMLMSHRAGLVREPPVGNYFDPTEPTLEKTVASLNGVELVYPPGEKQKYSNAGIAVVGRVVEVVEGEEFAAHLSRHILEPIGMGDSSFEPTPGGKRSLADAVMWTYHGREFPAPTFELGESPAGCMYSTVTDIAKFLSCLFAGGKPLLKLDTLEAMFKPQFVETGAKDGFGIGFLVSDFDGHRQVSHGGAIYGFATTFSGLTDEKLGVVVVCSRDVSNAVTGRIADAALKLALAAKHGKPLPEIERSEPLKPGEARALAGRYRADEQRYVDLTESAGRLYLVNRRFKIELKRAGKDLITDDVQSWGFKVTPGDDALIVNGRTLKRESRTGPPPEPPAKWKGLIGEYGWDHNVLFIYEQDGKLFALIEWTEIDPLTEESENVYAFPPDREMYHGQKLIFTRDASGQATKVEAAKVVFERCKIDGENGETFRIKPQRPLNELRKDALAAAPPKEVRVFRAADLVDLTELDPTIKLDVRYATANNFLGAPVYTSAKAFLQRPAAEALKKVSGKLKDSGYGLLVYDAYRPWYVTKMFWDATPEKFHNFVADPSKGSRHNRGCAVDLGLYDLKTGKPVEMVSGYDEFSDRAYPDYPGGTSRQRWHRDLLRRTMEDHGFTVYEAEWWHFDYKDWREYPIQNLRFEDVTK